MNGQRDDIRKAAHEAIDQIIDELAPDRVFFGTFIFHGANAKDPDHVHSDLMVSIGPIDPDSDDVQKLARESQLMSLATLGGTLVREGRNPFELLFAIMERSSTAYDEEGSTALQVRPGDDLPDFFVGHTPNAPKA